MATVTVTNIDPEDLCFADVVEGKAYTVEQFIKKGQRHVYGVAKGDGVVFTDEAGDQVRALLQDPDGAILTIEE